MHKGVVHDEGPIGMAEDPENGEIYLFYHPTDPVKVQNKLLPFKNGRLGSEEARYLGGQAVELTHEQVNDKLILTEGRVTIEHELDPVTDQEVSTGMVNWRTWKRKRRFGPNHWPQNRKDLVGHIVQ